MYAPPSWFWSVCFYNFLLLNYYFIYPRAIHNFIPFAFNSFTLFTIFLFYYFHIACFKESFMSYKYKLFSHNFVLITTFILIDKNDFRIFLNIGFHRMKINKNKINKVLIVITWNWRNKLFWMSTIVQVMIFNSELIKDIKGNHIIEKLVLR